MKITPLMGLFVLVAVVVSCKPDVQQTSDLLLKTTADTVTGIDNDATVNISWDVLTSGALKDGVGSNLEFFLRAFICQNDSGKARCQPVPLQVGGAGKGFLKDGSTTPVVSIQARAGEMIRPDVTFATVGESINLAASHLPKKPPGAYWLAIALYEDDGIFFGGTDFVGWSWSELGKLDKDTVVVIRDSKTGASAGLKIDARDGPGSGRDGFDLAALNFNHLPISHIKALMRHDYLCPVPEKVANYTSCAPTLVPAAGTSSATGEMAYLMPFGNIWLVFARQVDAGTSYPYYKLVDQAPLTMSARAVADTIIFGKKELARAQRRVTALTVMLHALPGGAAADYFVQEGFYSGEAWLSVAGDLGMVLTGGAGKVIKITGMTLQSGVVIVRGHQVVRASREGDWIQAGAASAEILLRVVNIGATVRALRAGIPQSQVLLAATKASEAVDVATTTMKTTSGMVVRVAGRRGPGVTDDVLEGAQRLANEVDHPIVLYGSRQTGVSEKTGQLFRPDSDVDIGVLEVNHLLGNITEPMFVQRFHRYFEHGPSAVFSSAEEVVKKGYVVVYPFK